MTSWVLSPSQTPAPQTLPHRAKSCVPRLNAQPVLHGADEVLYDQARGRILPVVSLVASIRPPRAESCPPSWITPQKILVVPSVPPSPLSADARAAWLPALLFAITLGVLAGKNYVLGREYLP